MIQLTNRQKALQYDPLANYIAKIQSDQIMDQIEFASSEEEIEEIKGIYDVANFYEETSGNNLNEKIIYHPEDDLRVYPSLLSNALTRFFRDTNIDSFFVLPHIKLSLVSLEDNNIAPLQHAQQLFLSASNGEKYDEAYTVDVPSFSEVIQALFWIVRYDATVPEFIFMYPEGANYFISLCKYGNLHFYIPPESDQSALLDSLKESGLQQWKGKEYERFSDSRAIEGRFTTLT